MSVSIGTTYSENQLQRALDAVARGEPAQTRVRRWRAIVEGLSFGTLAVGSRTPVDRYPEWVTLEVATGGFATGSALAAGPLLPHEVALLAELGLADADCPRLALNRYFLSDLGLVRLFQAVASRHLVIEVPEEAVLPTVAWLVVHGHTDIARELVDAIIPFAHELRFYPRLDAAASTREGFVHLEPVGKVVERLRSIPVNPRMLAQHDTVGTWTPLYDAAVGLALETIDGPLPIASKDEEGGWLRGERGQFVVQGGWPFTQLPADWPMRVKALVDAVGRARSLRDSPKRFSRAGEPFVVLMDALVRVANAGEALSARELGRVRLILARYVATRGTPDSDTALAERALHRIHATATTHQQVAMTVAERLAVHAHWSGVDDLDAVMSKSDALSANETGEEDEPVATPLPCSVLRRLQRCVNDTPEGLIKRRVVTSAEMLAALLPQRTGQLRAASFDDGDLRTLYAATYQAFRRRRSLLLLNLRKQVGIENLPWVAAMERFRKRDPVAAQAASAALEEFSLLALGEFPQTMLPNKLVKEFVALAAQAGRKMPFAEELAADIFMGGFSHKFVDAAQVAASHLSDSLYARYYRLDYQDIARRLSAVRPRDVAAKTLANICAERAGEPLGTWAAASNGRIIEQQLIVTSQNLAVLLELPGMRDALASRAGALARVCYAWTLRHLQWQGAAWNAELHRIKNAAYAWRQMVFLLSLRESELPAFLAEADALLDQQPQTFAQAFRPALNGLQTAATRPHVWGASSEPAPFLGWKDTQRWRVRTA
jgi:hypothetical protein